MSGIKKEKGFIRTHQYKREHGVYMNTHRSRGILDEHKALKFPLCHKKRGASTGLSAKQFDVSRRDYCKHFYSRKCVADLIDLPHICWGFGHHLTLGGNQKFAYKY